MCGSTTMPSAFQNGCSDGSGSWRKTSRMAPAIFLFFAAAIRSASTIVWPRPKLISQAPVFIAANRSALMKLSVSLVAGSSSSSTMGSSQKAANTTAWPGRSTPVETTVAIELAAS